MKLSIEFIEQEEQRFYTVGDWTQLEDGTIKIWITKFDDWRSSFMILMHELVEIGITLNAGIKSKDCDDFDAMWEEELKRGLHADDDEPGWDKRCPYKRGHFWGDNIERFFCFIFKIKWDNYEKDCLDKLI